MFCLNFLTMEQSPSQPTSTTLLNLASPPPADPWGAQPPAPAASGITISDPWGTSSPAHKNPPPAATDEWGAPVVSSQLPASDPWGASAPAASKPAADAWGGISAAPAQPPAPSDPWGASPAAPAAAPTTQKDPWAVNGGGAAPDPDAEFDKLRVNMDGMISANNSMDAFAPAPTMTMMSAPPPQSGVFDLTGMDQALADMEDRKKPEDFLGKNSKLVNLESLIGPTRETVGQPSMQGTNPFVMAAGNVAATQQPPVANPFQQQRNPAPTINQMRAQPVAPINPGIGTWGMDMAGGASMGVGTSLPAPLLPSTGGIPPAQPQQQTNPFLL